MTEYPRKHEIDSFINPKEAEEFFLTVMNRDKEIESLIEQIKKLKNKQQRGLHKLSANGWRYFKVDGGLFCIRELEPSGELYLTLEVLLDLDAEKNE